MILGITSGAMLTESAIIVPFWKSLSTTEFYDWYKKHHQILVDFYTPIEIASFLSTLVTTVLLMYFNNRGKWMMMISCLLAFGVLVTFFLFFKSANMAFIDARMNASQLAESLRVWGNWQWIRVCLGLGAFGFGLIGWLKSFGSYASDAY